MRIDLNNVVAKLGKLEKTLRQKIESGVLVKEVKHYADVKSKLLKQKVNTNKDLKKVVALVEQRKKQIEKVAKEFPRDVKVVRSYVQSQRKELKKISSKLLSTVKAAQAKSATAGKAKTTTKKAAPRKTSKKAASRK